MVANVPKNNLLERKMEKDCRISIRKYKRLFREEFEENIAKLCELNLQRCKPKAPETVTYSARPTAKMTNNRDDKENSPVVGQSLHKSNLKRSKKRCFQKDIHQNSFIKEFGPFLKFENRIKTIRKLANLKRNQ